MATACPQCGAPVIPPASGERPCPICGAMVPAEAAGPAELVTDTPQRSEAVAEFDLVPRAPDSQLTLEPPRPEVNLRLSSHGETLAVLALLLPVAAQGLGLAISSESPVLYVALSWGSVIVTALLLAVDAALLGRVDLKGVQRGSPAGIFLAVLLLWIVGYPVAFFRRRHYGRPNLGPLALLVALFFVGAPLLHNLLRVGVLDSGVPTCDSREVVTMVNELIRDSSIRSTVQSISDHKEIQYDPAAQTRKGQCQIRTATETITATYTVKMVNRTTGSFQVVLDSLVLQDPPSCADPDVLALLESRIRQGPNGHLLTGVDSPEEVRYDRATKTRHGRCRATFPGRTENVAYKVYWLDPKTGQFQVEIEP